MYSLYEITDNGLSFISKHVSSTMAMIESSARPSDDDWTEEVWQYFQTPVHETWISEKFCIIKEVSNAH